MKTTACICGVLFLMLMTFHHSLVAGEDPEKPIAGRSFTIRYAAPETMQFKADLLRVVYVFDYWGTTATSDRSPSALYANVTNPDPARVHTVPLKKAGESFAATIDIPASASLLSYYVTDGTTMDDNAGKTYVQYVCDPTGKPVMGARFRNIDFLVMARMSIEDQIGELAAELKDYPQNHVAYIPYWMVQFSTVTSLDSLAAFKPAIESMLTSMEQHAVSLDTVQNIRAGIYFRYALRLRALNSTEYKAALRDLETKIEAIPEAKRFPYVRSIYLNLKQGGYEP